MTKKWIVEIISLLFLILFLYTAVSKIIDFEKFEATIGQSPLLVNKAGFIAIFIPAVEIILSILLILPKWRLLALYGSFTLMILFTSYIIAILNFSEHIPCACGGVIGTLGWKAHLVFNIVFILLSIIAIILIKGEETKKTSVTASI